MILILYFRLGKFLIKSSNVLYSGVPKIAELGEISLLF